MADVRNHPAINYYRSGVPIVIAGDDPGSFGYNDLTVDYYLAYLSWGFSLFDLREIANNSIRYSSSVDSVKSNGLGKFTTMWLNFVDTTYSRICSNTNLRQANINVTNVYPTYGPNYQTISITIYGYGYESMFCQAIKCFFDDVQTDGYLNALNELSCETPLGFGDNQIAKISIGNGNIKVKTGLEYKFVSSSLINVIDDEITSPIPNSSMKIIANSLIFLQAFILMWSLNYD